MNVVCGVITDGAGRILACQRPPGGHLAGMWEFPGGKIEPGETPAAALVRELREELGVQVETGPQLRAVDWDYGSRPFRLIPLRCRIIQGTPVLHEHSDCRWCDAETARTLPWAPADVPILEALWDGNPGEW